MTTAYVLQNPNATSITLDVTYYVSDDVPVSAGSALGCDQLTVAGNSAITFDPAVQRHLDAIFSSPHNVFGR